MKDAQTKPKSILAQEMFQENFAYTTNAEFVPVCAHLETGILVVPPTSHEYNLEEVGLEKRQVHERKVAAVIGEETTSQPGNHGVPVSSPGESVLKWVTRIEEETEQKVIAVTMREHSGYEGDDYEFITITFAKYEFEKLRRRVRDALNKTTDNQALIDCALRLSVKL